MSANRTRGVTFRTYRELLVREHGEDSESRVLAALSEPFGAQLRYGGIVRGGWYPLEWYRELHAATREQLDLGLEWARFVGRESTRGDLTEGIFRVIVKVVSVERLIAQAPRIFGRYYERGRMRVDRLGPAHVRTRYEGCVGFDENLWHDVFGGTEGGALAGGVRDLETRVVSGGGDGDEEAVFELSWTP